jgi:hypothetical protein
MRYICDKLYTVPVHKKIHLQTFVSRAEGTTEPKLVIA